MSQTRGDKFRAIVDAVDAYLEDEGGLISVALPNGWVLVRAASEEYRLMQEATSRLYSQQRWMNDMAMSIQRTRRHVDEMVERALTDPAITDRQGAVNDNDP